MTTPIEPYKYNFRYCEITNNEDCKLKTVILAGGFGTRLSEETDKYPKPLVEIDGRPIIWHIMKMYAQAGHTDFVVCCGYKSEMIKSYFVNYFTRNYDMRVDLGANSIEYFGNPKEDWRVTLIDTGLHTMTGGRIKRIKDYIDDEPFFLTYGDGVSDVDLDALLKHHKSTGKKATVTAVPSPGRFGILEIDGDNVDSFREKPSNEMGWINGGFFVLEPSVIDYIENDDTVWEQEPLKQLAVDKELSAYKHTGFWQPMDSLRDKRNLEDICATGKAPWLKT